MATNWTETNRPVGAYLPDAPSLYPLKTEVAASYVAKGSLVFNAKDYGATGDGVTNDTAALQSALTAAAGKSLYIPSGTYLVNSTLNVSSNTSIYGDGLTTVIRATDTADYQYMILVDTKSNVYISNLKVDGRMTQRIAANVVNRCVGIALLSSTDCAVERVLITGTFASTSAVPGVGVAIGGTSLRCTVTSSRFIDCGTAGRASDGVFSSGTQNLVSDCVAVNCTDTGFVIESSNYSGIVGCTATGCSAGAGLTNAVNTVADSNYIDGLVVNDWNASVTGGIQIGNPASSSTGNLTNSLISNVVIRRVAGSGPAINVRKTGTARTVGLTLSNIKVFGSGTQGILLDGTDGALITGCTIQSTPGAPIQVQTGCTDVIVEGCFINPAASVATAVVVVSADNVRLIGNVIKGDGTTNGNGAYWFNTCANALALSNVITGFTTNRIGSDAGTTPVEFSATTNGLVVGKSSSNVIGFYGSSGTSRQTLAASPTTDQIRTVLLNLGLVQ